MSTSSKTTTKTNRETAIAALPDFLDQADALGGFEDMNRDTQAIPFLKLAQALTPQVAQKAERIEGLLPGHFFNSVTREVYGERLQVIVLAFERVFLEWAPERGGFLGRHTFENAERLAVSKEFGEWKTKEGNELQETYCYYVLIVGREKEGVCVFSVSSSGLSTAKKLNRELISTVLPDGTKPRPYWLRFEISSVEKSGDKGNWHGFEYKRLGLIDEGQNVLVKAERIALPGKAVDYAQLEHKAPSRAAMPPDANIVPADEDPFSS